MKVKLYPEEFVVSKEEIEDTLDSVFKKYGWYTGEKISV